jgi:glycyl-tRNA synthetase (class II)
VQKEEKSEKKVKSGKKSYKVATPIRRNGVDYAKGDEIGIPYAITIDYDSMKDESVTIRFRNDGNQQRVKIDECSALIRKFIKESKVSL